MPEKKNIKTIKGVDLAAGFFTERPAKKTEKEESVQKSPSAVSSKKEAVTESFKAVNKGGRPKKEGLKNENYTLTLSPKLYEQTKIIAQEMGISFSFLVSESVKYYCEEKRGIKLDEIIVPDEKLEKYLNKQKKNG